MADKIKIAILGSLTLGDYEVLAPQKFDPDLYESDHEAAYEKAKEVFYPFLEESKFVIAFVPEPTEIGEHTAADIGHAMDHGVPVILVTKKALRQAFQAAELTKNIDAPLEQRYMWLL